MELRLTNQSNSEWLAHAFNEMKRHDACRNLDLHAHWHVLCPYKEGE